MDDLSLAKRSNPPPAPATRNWPDDDEALLELTPDGKTKRPENYWCLKDAFEGVQIFGGTGSGKSSGSGQALAKAFVESNLGGLVLTAKVDEVLAWKRYAKAAGRESELLIVERGAPHKFNFLRYELKRPGTGAGHAENLVNLFCSVLEAAERKPGQGGGQDAYWQRTLKQLLRNAIDLAVMSLDDIDLPSLYRIITSAPRSADEAESAEWKKSSACYGLLEVAGEKTQGKARKNDFELTRDFWLREFPGLAPETRSVIVSTFTSMADCFLRGLLRDLFCTDLTFAPEDTFNGKIIVLNLPVKEFNELGQFAQVLFKFIWQRAVERRISAEVSREAAQATARPVFLWADESQFFVNSYDALFQSTARSSRACTVYLTQNLPGYFSAFGGQNARTDAESFLGNLQTKIFHANGGPLDQQLGSGFNRQNPAGTVLRRFVRSYGKGGAGGLSQNAGGSMVVEYVVQPQEFTMLRTGGAESGFLVDSIIFQGGRRWLAMRKGEAVAQNYIRHVFSQKE